MKTRLHEEAARRRMLDMYSLSTYGLRVLEEHKRICSKLADDHRAYLDSPLCYPYVGMSLCKRAQRCKRDVEALCQSLDAEIQRFGSQDAPGDNEEAVSQTHTWLDAVLTALLEPPDASRELDELDTMCIIETNTQFVLSQIKLSEYLVDYVEIQVRVAQRIKNELKEGSAMAFGF
ncbi:hypothetical protein B0H13DRAFT_1900860 [Mycena leptocephala]|nr:hypothetical protein B0H13DRAFT_1900860 [Mycena leptocephala]